ncbi:MAG: glycerophosphodiester phosphodiesterase family protein [Clostridiales bacterium]|nr:glycerophosphodiester phosphodiesterase family protein [Clostridiales bacterium]
MSCKIKNTAPVTVTGAAVIIGILFTFFGIKTVNAAFADVSESAWYNEYVTEAAVKGWFGGDENGCFNPEQSTTRAQAARVVYSYLYGDDLPSAQGFCYTDAELHSWYAPYVNINKAYGVIPDYGEYFEPEVYITRNDAVIAVMNSTGMNVSGADTSVLYRFSDWENIEPQNRAYMAAAVENGLLNGFEDATLRINAPITRAQFAAFMSKGCGPLWQQGSIDDEGNPYDTDLRIRTDYFYTPACVVHTDPDMRLAFIHYSEDGLRSFTYNSGWRGNEVYLPAGCYRIVSAYTGDLPIELAKKSAVRFDYTPSAQEPYRELRTIAHRGCSADAPENTIPAFELAADRGYEHIECDVRWTSDGFAVILHDKTISAVSNGTGVLSAMSFADVRQYDFGSYKGARYSGTKIASFEELMEVCKRRGIHPYVEIYDGESFTQQRAKGLMRIAEMYGMEERITWISSYYSALETIKSVSQVENLRMLYVVSVEDYSLKWKLAALKNAKNRVGLDVDYRYLNSDYVSFMNNAGFDVEAWTVDDYAKAQELIAMGVTGITTNSILPF